MKTFRRAFKKHPYGVAGALLALGSVATAFGRSGQLRQLKDGAVRRLTAARNAFREDEAAAHH